MIVIGFIEIIVVMTVIYRIVVTVSFVNSETKFYYPLLDRELNLTSHVQIVLMLDRMNEFTNGF